MIFTGPVNTEGLYEPGYEPGIDRPWRYGDAYFIGEGNNRIAMRVTDPEMANLPQIQLPSRFR